MPDKKGQASTDCVHGRAMIRPHFNLRLVQPTPCEHVLLMYTCLCGEHTFRFLVHASVLRVDDGREMIQHVGSPTRLCPYGRAELALQDIGLPLSEPLPPNTVLMAYTCRCGNHIELFLVPATYVRDYNGDQLIKLVRSRMVQLGNYPEQIPSLLPRRVQTPPLLPRRMLTPPLLPRRMLTPPLLPRRVQTPPLLPKGVQTPPSTLRREKMPTPPPRMGQLIMPDSEVEEVLQSVPEWEDIVLLPVPERWDEVRLLPVEWDPYFLLWNGKGFADSR